MTRADAIEFDVVVERSRIVEFRRAIGDHSGDPDLAPPTFVVVADQFDPSFPRRPPVNGPWPPTDGMQARLHVEQRIDIERPLVAGERVRVRRHPVRTWERHGRRAGRLTFFDHTTELIDESGRCVVRSQWVDVEAERSHLSLSKDTTSGASAEPAEGATTVTVVGDVTRTMLVMYVGVAGDFHPLHHDEVYAQSHGYPSVFAPGMLTMAVTGFGVRSVVPEAEMSGFGGRFRAQVWPGDRLDCEVLPTSSGCHVSTRNQHGVCVFEGWATRR